MLLMPTTEARANTMLSAAAISNPASRAQRGRLSGARRGLWRVLWLGENWNA